MGSTGWSLGWSQRGGVGVVGRFSASGTPSPEPHPCLTSRTCLKQLDDVGRSLGPDTWAGWPGTWRVSTPPPCRSLCAMWTTLQPCERCMACSGAMCHGSTPTSASTEVRACANMQVLLGECACVCVCVHAYVCACPRSPDECWVNGCILELTVLTAHVTITSMSEGSPCAHKHGPCHWLSVCHVDIIAAL
jgi:hypothetical protein